MYMMHISSLSLGALEVGPISMREGEYMHRMHSIPPPNSGPGDKILKPYHFYSTFLSSTKHTFLSYFLFSSLLHN